MLYIYHTLISIVRQVKFLFFATDAVLSGIEGFRRFHGLEFTTKDDKGHEDNHVLPEVIISKKRFLCGPRYLLKNRVDIKENT